jgi:hypothetical protein
LAADRGSPLWLNGLVLGLALLPAATVLLLHIWVPTAMIQEAFGVSYASVALMRLGYFLVPVGHAFTLLFSYPSRLYADVVTANGSNFAEYQVFGITSYVLTGLALAATVMFAIRGPLTLMERLLLIFVGFSKPFIMRMTNFGLSIDYDKMEPILYVILAYWWMARPALFERRPLVGTISAGLLTGLSTATKLTLLPVIGVLAVPLIWNWSRNCPGLQRFGLWMCYMVATLVTYTTLILAYFLFNWQYLIRFGRETVARFSTDSLVQQSSPFLWFELRRWLDPRSYYFGWQALATIAACLLILIGFECVKTRDRRPVAFLLACVFSGAVLTYELARRTAGNSILDWAAWLAFVAAVGASMLLRRFGHAYLVKWVAAILGFTCVASLILQNPADALQRFQHNSRTAEAIQARISAAGELPHVYYMHASPQPLMFPSIDLSVVNTSALSPEAHDAFVAQFHPLARWADPANGPLAIAHVMIVPEYVDVLPDSPDVVREWPGRYAPVTIFGADPRFDAIREDPANACQSYMYDEQDRTYLHNLYQYATRVTVCQLSAR